MIKTVKQACRFNPVIRDYRMAQGIENLAALIHDEGDGRELHFNWTHVSVIAGLTRTNCLFRLHEGSIKKEEIVAFLNAQFAQGTRAISAVEHLTVITRCEQDGTLLADLFDGRLEQV